MTRGARLKVLMILVVLYAIEIGLEALLGSTLMPDYNFYSGGWEGDIRRYYWVRLATRIVWAGVKGTAAAVAYHDLRVSKEGVSVEELNRVFE